MAIHFVRLVAQRVRTAARFEARDPWNGHAEGEFSIEECVYLPEHLDLSSPRALRAMGSGTVFLLRSEQDGVERLLPEALVELWQTDRVRAEQLPQLLAERPGEVEPRHAIPILHRRLGRAIAVGLVAAVVGIGGFLLGRGAYRERVDRGKPLRMEAAAWLAAPAAAGQRLMLDGFLPLAGRDDEYFEPALPRWAEPPPDREARLAWARAPEGHRLVLLPRRSYFPSPDRVEVNMALVVETAEAGIPPEVLSRLSRQVPDLDDRLVLARGWRVDHNALGFAGVMAGLSFFLGLVGAAGVGGMVLAVPILRVRQAGRRREMAATLARLGGAHGRGGRPLRRLVRPPG